MKTLDLSPGLQTFYDLFMELDPNNDLTTFERIRKGIKYCIDNDVEPAEALEDISTCLEPFINVQ